jgi:hypothetical protein
VIWPEQVSGTVLRETALRAAEARAWRADAGASTVACCALTGAVGLVTVLFVEEVFFGSVVLVVALEVVLAFVGVTAAAAVPTGAMTLIASAPQSARTPDLPTCPSVLCGDIRILSLP